MKKVFSSILDFICKIFFNSCRKNFWKACQKCKLGVQRRISWETNFWRGIKFFNIFVFRAKTCRTFVEQNLAGLSKLHSSCPEERLRKFWRKSYNSFPHSQNMSKELSILLQRLFGRLVNITFWVSGENQLFEISICSSLPDRFWIANKNFPEIWWKSFSTVVQNAFNVSEEESVQNYFPFGKNFILIRFSRFNKNIGVSGHKDSAELSKLIFRFLEGRCTEFFSVKLF